MRVSELNLDFPVTESLFCSFWRHFDIAIKMSNYPNTLSSSPRFAVWHTCSIKMATCFKKKIKIIYPTPHVDFKLTSDHADVWLNAASVEHLHLGRVGWDGTQGSDGECDWRKSNKVVSLAVKKVVLCFPKLETCKRCPPLIFFFFFRVFALLS